MEEQSLPTENNYALTFFILCGISTGGAYIMKVDYSEVGIGPVSTTDSPQVIRIFIFSPDYAESFYTY